MRSKNAAQSSRPIPAVLAASALWSAAACGIAAGVVAAGPVVARGGEGRLVWSVRSQMTPPPGGEAEIPAVAIGPGFVAWSTGRGIHAARLADGEPLFGGGPSATELVSAAGVAGGLAAPSSVRLSRPCQSGGRLFATVTATAAEASAGRIVAIDCSPAGGGRIEWVVGPPQGAMAFEGPPWIDGERLSVIVRGDGPTRPRLLARFDRFDGRHLGSEPAAETDAAPRPFRRGEAGGGRIVVATDRTIECREVDAAVR